MAKKNNLKQHQQLLSPENYIRQKARNLPIYECKVNKTWQAQKFTPVIVSRKHANGNISLGLFLVDLGCLGVKDSFFRFNIDKYEYDEIIDKLNDNSELMNISYALAHNIVYAALAYADELGFKPCKEFTQTTRFMLEEDTDDVEFIDIECGMNGKPFYVNAGHDSKIRERQIINQLEKSVGKGNFNYIMGKDDDNDFFKDDDEDDDEFDLYEKYEAMSLDELKVAFIEIVQKKSLSENLRKSENLRLITDEIYTRICDEEVTDAYINDWLDETKIEIEENQFSARFLDVNEGTPISKSTAEFIDTILINLTKNLSDTFKRLHKLEKSIGKTALTAFIELIILDVENSGNYGQKLNEYFLQYPEYGLIKLLKYANDEVEKEDNSAFVLPKIKDIFSGIDKITEFEFNHFISEMAMLIFLKNDINLLEAFYSFIDNLKIPDGYYDILKDLVFYSRISLLVTFFDNDLSKTANKSNLRIVKSEGKSQKQSNRFFQFKIQLMGVSKPPVWRRIVIPDNASFDEFHDVIQIAFGWQNYHLYNFSPSGWGSNPVIAKPSEFDEQPVLNATVTELKDIFDTVGKKFRYIYDFGDNWEHQIVLEEIHINHNPTPPMCLEGKGSCPPEDCGGAMGYQDLKELFLNPKDPEYKETMRWLGIENGSDWNSNEFNIYDVNEKLSMLM